MGSYEGVGERIRDALLAKGYKRDDGKPDVQRFCWDGRYDRTLVYDWLQNRATPFKDLVRLSRDLGVTIEWLLTGEDTAKKALPRRHRGGLRNLLLVFAVAAGLWPSGSASAHTPAISGGNRLTGSTLSEVRRRWRESFDFFTFRIAIA